MAFLQLLAGALCIHSLTPQQRYHVPVPIPANGDAHFKVLNAVDGSYHFGYDTGENKYEFSYSIIRMPS
jgi:hypothetical protein